jgi:hypothetical protein
VQSAQLENCQIKNIDAGVALIDHHISNQMEKPIYQIGISQVFACDRKGAEAITKGFPIL